MYDSGTKVVVVPARMCNNFSTDQTFWQDVVFKKRDTVFKHYANFVFSCLYICLFLFFLRFKQ